MRLLSKTLLCTKKECRMCAYRLLVQIQTELPEEIQFCKQSQKRLHWEVKVVYVSQNCYENKGGKLNKALVDDHSLL